MKCQRIKESRRESRARPFPRVKVKTKVMCAGFLFIFISVHFFSQSLIKFGMHEDKKESLDKAHCTLLPCLTEKGIAIDFILGRLIIVLRAISQFTVWSQNAIVFKNRKEFTC